MHICTHTCMYTKPTTYKTDEKNLSELANENLYTYNNTTTQHNQKKRKNGIGTDLIVYVIYFNFILPRDPKRKSI